jgi:hypothetical protein
MFYSSIPENQTTRSYLHEACLNLEMKYLNKNIRYLLIRHMYKKLSDTTEHLLTR